MAVMPCPACHHPEHDPGSCPECPRCELHVDEALIWVSRVAREDYDEFVEAIEADAIKAAINDLIPKLHRALRGRGLAVWEIEQALRAALRVPVEAPLSAEHSADLRGDTQIVPASGASSETAGLDVERVHRITCKRLIEHEPGSDKPYRWPCYEFAAEYARLAAETGGSE